MVVVLIVVNKQKNFIKGENYMNNKLESFREMEDNVIEYYNKAMETDDQGDWKNYFDVCEKATKLGSRLAPVGLAECYTHGYGVNQDMSKGVDVLKKSADDGNGAAMLMLNKYYRMGIGVEKNEELAFEYLQKAVENGVPVAKSIMARYYVDGYMVERDFRQAFQLWQEAFKQGEKGNAAYLAQCYLYGIGTRRNTILARKYADIAKVSSPDFNDLGVLEKLEQAEKEAKKR